MAVFFVRWLELTLSNLINPIPYFWWNGISRYIKKIWLHLDMGNFLTSFCSRILIHHAIGESVWILLIYFKRLLELTPTLLTRLRHLYYHVIDTFRYRSTYQLSARNSIHRAIGESVWGANNWWPYPLLGHWLARILIHRAAGESVCWYILWDG